MAGAGGYSTQCVMKGALTVLGLKATLPFRSNHDYILSFLFCLNSLSLSLGHKMYGPELM